MKINTLLLSVAFLWIACNNQPPEVNHLSQLPENPLLLHPITTSTDAKRGTMSTLYGNDLALMRFSMNTLHSYTPGSVLFQVTWKQQEDPVWFGAYIPGKVLLVERIAFDEKNRIQFTRYSWGSHPDTIGTIRERIELITAQNRAVSP